MTPCYQNGLLVVFVAYVRYILYIRCEMNMLKTSHIKL